VSAAFNAADVQGNILRGYRKALVRYLMIEVTERAAARRWLVATVTNRDGLPQITTEEPWVTKPETCFNIGLTYEGLRALGTRGASLETFPTEFSAGMASRAVKLGDVGPSAPQTWPAPFDNPKRLHLILSIYGDALPQIERIQQQALTAGSGLTLLGTRDGWTEEGNFVHFGYRDSIAQPKFKEIHDPADYADGQPPAPLGTVLLGYETNFENLLFRVPTPPELGFNGSFNAFRVLAQDVVGFEAYLDKAACDLLKHPHVDDLLAPGAEATIGAGLSRKAALREIVAANMCGRWRCGTPLALSPYTPNPQPTVPLEDFDYTETSTCPYGAHIRRANPRGGKIVQRVANHSRRLIRRGMPYGPVYDPADPKPEVERGLLGNFIGANLGAQFEAMSCDWLNLGLQDPRITGSNDPLLGANDPETSWFDLPLKSGEVIRLRGLPRFVQTRGGAYTFLPSISAIRHLGSLNT
jgi:deferrochelatase/peroxidase EfeB